MPSFSQKSRARLDTCHADLQKVFDRIITKIDCTIIEGSRSIEDQREYFRTGKSHLNPDEPGQLAKCKHLTTPSQAVDVLPCPIDWKDRERIALFAGFVLATADDLDVRLLWGGNWDRDFSTLDKTAGFFDGPHYQLMEE
jgi:peptidoglycan LD-endopeptidase CwlK